MKKAEILNVRLRGGVVDQRVALGESRGHDRVLRRRHRRFVEKHLLADELPRTHVIRVRRGLDLRTERFESEEMRVYTATADRVAARLGHRHLAATSEQRAGEKNRRANLLRQFRIGIR